MKAIFNHIGQFTEEFHPAVRFFIFLVVTVIALCAITLVYAVITSGAPEIKVG